MLYIYLRNLDIEQCGAGKVLLELHAEYQWREAVCVRLYNIYWGNTP